MKKVFLLVATLFLGLISMQAQSFEPDFVGEVNLVKGNTATLLDKEFVQVKSGANAGMLLVGVGAYRTKISIKGGYAKARALVSDSIRFVARAVDNMSDPLSIIQIFKFSASPSKRTAELSSVNTFGQVTGNKLKLVKYTAKKYGQSSYLISLDEKAAGEYGIIVSNPNNKDEKNVIVACFGIDPE